eukprot:7365207-Pyramimonas_sp.AAC.1
MESKRRVSNAAARRPSWKQKYDPQLPDQDSARTTASTPSVTRSGIGRWADGRVRALSCMRKVVVLAARSRLHQIGQIGQA